MLSLGLQPLDSRTGEPCMSAHQATHREMPGGAFDRAFASLPSTAMLPWSAIDAQRINGGMVRGERDKPGASDGDGESGSDGDGEAKPAAPSRNKVKYTCPKCHTNVWGKPELVIFCGPCDAAFALAG
jgi:hypothetical protein